MKKLPPHEAKPASAQLRLGPSAPVVTNAPTLTNLLAAKRSKRKNAVRFLTALGAFYEAFGRVPPEYQSDVNIPVPAEAVDFIGKLLVGSTSYNKEANARRAEIADAEHAVWQAKANEDYKTDRARRQRNPQLPRLTLSAVAKRIDPDRWQYIRQVIRKPKIS